MKSASFCSLSVLATVLFFLAFAPAAEAKQAATADAPSAPSDTAAPAPETVGPAPGSVTVGDLSISHMSTESSKGHIDIFMTIKNAGKVDERIGGAGSTWDIGDTVEVKKGPDGKEVESPVAIDVLAGKSVELSDSTEWIRIKSINTKPKDMSVLPLSLYFRHSPNASLQIPMGKGEDKSWFSK